jgi:ligand-binding sensor domain-containing protein
MLRHFIMMALIAARMPAAGPRIRLPVEEGNDVVFNRIVFENGSSHATVTQILQDRTGFLWFGTNDGLRRYDGYGFREFRPEANSSSGLSGLAVKALFEDRWGKLWVASDLTADRYDPAMESFTHFPVLEGPVHHLAADGDGSILLATAFGLERFDPAAGKFTRYINAFAVIRATLLQKNGTLWVTDKESIGIFDRQARDIRDRIPLRDAAAIPGGRSANPTVTMLEDHAGVLWVASERDGLARVDLENRRLVYFRLVDAPRN